MSLELPTIPNFRVLRALGHGAGAAGSVFEAEEYGDLKLRRAVKVLDGGPFGGADPRERFARECRALSKLDHRALARYVMAGYTTDATPLPYIVMAFVEGASLRVAAEGMTVAARVQSVVHVLEGLAYAHSQGVLHRDVKPANIVVRASDGQPVLVDFGAAYLFDVVDAVETLSPLGTPGFVPPEVLADHRYRAPTHDVFSTAVTLYQLLAGRLPILNDVMPLSRVDPALGGLDAIVMKGLAPEPARYRSAADFRTALVDWLSVFERRQHLGHSPAGRALALKLRAAKDERDRSQAIRDQNAAVVTQATERWRPDIIAGAEAAFQEAREAILSTLGECSLSRDPATLSPKRHAELGTLLLGLVREGVSFSIALAERGDVRTGMRDNHGTPGIAVRFVPPSRSTSSQVPERSRSFVPSCFAILSDRGGQRSPSVIHHAALAIELPGRTLEEQLTGSRILGQIHHPSLRAEVVLSDTSAVHEFILGVITSILVR